MKTTPALGFNSLLEKVLSLPRHERFDLAEKLILSLEDGGDIEVSQEWRAELDARVQRRERGETRSYGHEEVMSELDESISYHIFSPPQAQRLRTSGRETF